MPSAVSRTLCASFLFLRPCPVLPGERAPPAPLRIALVVVAVRAAASPARACETPFPHTP